MTGRDRGPRRGLSPDIDLHRTLGPDGRDLTALDTDGMRLDVLLDNEAPDVLLLPSGCAPWELIGKFLEAALILRLIQNKTKKQGKTGGVQLAETARLGPRREIQNRERARREEKR